MSSFDRIVEMVNADNAPTYPLTRESVLFIDVVVDPAGQWNTRVTMKAMANSGYTGQVDLFYTRANLTALGTLEFVQEAPFTVESLCSTINAAKAAQMSPEDLTNTSIPAMETGVVTTFTISAAANSLVWLSNAEVSLLTGIPAESHNLSNFLNTTAPALFA